MHPNQTSKPSLIQLLTRLSSLFILILSLIQISFASTPDLKQRQECNIKIENIQTVKDLNNSKTAPKSGWENVNLPDNWETRWKNYSGTAWYKIKWRYHCSETTQQRPPIMLALGYISMAGEVFSNGDTIWQDESLTEPFSRSWNTPRYFVLPHSSLKESNEILIRVVGIYQQMPGLGQVKIGFSHEILPFYNKMLWQQRTSFFINSIISLIVGIFFFVVWLFNRKETAFAWFSLSCILWVLFISNILTSTPFPFDNALTYGRFNLIFLLWHCIFFSLFTWRFIKKKVPIFENIIFTTTMILSCILLFIPEKNLILVSVFAIFYWGILFTLNCIYFQFLAYKETLKDIKILAMVLLSFILISIHDFYIFITGVDLKFLMAYSSPIITLAMAFIIAWRISSNIKFMSKFNETLKVNIDTVRTDLESSLEKKYLLEIENIRLQERLKLSHELHDGLGGSLVRSMILVDKNESLNKNHFLSILKLLRSDLRQVVDIGANIDTKPPETPVLWGAPLRRRFIQIFEEIDIQSQWIFPKNWQHQPTTHQCLTLARIVEEALTNVIKHSKATQIKVELSQNSHQSITLEISDNGVGFNPSIVEQSMHVGLQSMRTRVQRLNGEFIINSQPGATRIIVTV